MDFASPGELFCVGVDPSAAKGRPSSIENCFVCVVGGRSPPTTHTKLSLCTGRKRRRPAEARTRPPPMGIFSDLPGIEGLTRHSAL